MVSKKTGRPLVYSEKGVAIRALKKNFFENEDYTSFDQNTKRERGGTIIHQYRLTVACMEYFIARKVREVFEVYRQVFNAVADQMGRPTLPPTEMELLLQTLQANVAIAQKMVDTDRRVATLEQRLARFERIKPEEYERTGLLGVVDGSMAPQLMPNSVLLDQANYGTATGVVVVTLRSQPNRYFVGRVFTIDQGSIHLIPDNYSAWPGLTVDRTDITSLCEVRYVIDKPAE